MKNLKVVMHEAGIPQYDPDSIKDIPFQGIATSKNSYYQEHYSQAQKEQKFERYLQCLEVMLDFGYTEQQADMFLAKNSTVFTNDAESFRKKLLVMENFKYLDKALNSARIYEYSLNWIYAAFCFRNDQMKNNKKIGISTIIDNPLKFGYTQEELLKKYILTPEKIELLEHIHKVKKQGNKQIGGGTNK